MKKLIPFLVSSILVVGAVGCQDASKNASENPSTTNEATQPAKEASAKTKTTAKNPILSKLEAKIPGSKLVVAEKDGVVTVTGTVPTEADIKKIEPLVKEQKGVKTVKVEAKAASTKAK